VPILSLSKDGKPFALYTDASKEGLDVILMQDKKVIAYAT
jgi:hypothetical protein